MTKQVGCIQYCYIHLYSSFVCFTWMVLRSCKTMLTWVALILRSCFHHRTRLYFNMVLRRADLLLWCYYGTRGTECEFYTACKRVISLSMKQLYPRDQWNYDLQFPGFYSSLTFCLVMTCLWICTKKKGDRIIKDFTVELIFQSDQFLSCSLQHSFPNTWVACLRGRCTLPWRMKEEEEMGML